MEQYALNIIKWILAHDTLLTYTDLNESYKIYTDASMFQLGAVMSQKVIPIKFYSRNLTYDQQQHTVTER